MFIPSGKLLYREAAARVARYVANIANRMHPDGPTMTVADFLDECLNDLGRNLAAGHPKTWGLVTAGWLTIEGGVIDEGDEIELPPSIWRRLGTKLTMISPPEDGWLPGEIAYGDGRAIVLVDEASLASFIDTMSDAMGDMMGDEPSAARPTRPPTAPERVAELSRWMMEFARGAKAKGAVVKRDDAIRAITVACNCTVREAKAAYEALPHPELRNPPPAARATHLRHRASA